ncbi:hypothetical protein [Cupriavidus pauculus]|uniref:hypothetical protein n=1 Tax=Cupriavidus pauculus TaxID=82633 RepID=UPI000AE89D12|nr:hypothetical protein [Cupriavidus pauculus]
MPLSPELQTKVDRLRRMLEAAAQSRTIEYAGYGGQIMVQHRKGSALALACLALSDEELAEHVPPH